MTQLYKRDKVDTTLIPLNEPQISQLSKCGQGLDYPKSVGEQVGKGRKSRGKQAFCHTD